MFFGKIVAAGHITFGIISYFQVAINFDNLAVVSLSNQEGNAHGRPHVVGSGCSSWYEVTACVSYLVYYLRRT